MAGPLAAIGDAPPTRLKAVGDTPRRLIPTNGQTIAAFIHTADEAPPWRGLPLATAFRVSIVPPAGSPWPAEWYQDVTSRTLATLLTVTVTTPLHVLEVHLG